jgi:hypothetical protein
MRDLSLKGIARKYRAKSGAISVKQDILGTLSISGTVSLRSRLEELARKQISFGVSECVYRWTAGYEQVWTHIVVRIKLDPDDGITEATMDTLRDTWAEGIATRWSDQWGCGRSGELTCPLTFEVQWVNSGQHHTVRVAAGSGGSEMTTWYTNLDGRIGAAHEVGHMFGHPDEYGEAACPDREPVDTGSIMHRPTGDIHQRLMRRFAENIGSSVVGI